MFVKIPDIDTKSDDVLEQIKSAMLVLVETLNGHVDKENVPPLKTLTEGDNADELHKHRKLYSREGQEVVRVSDAGNLIVDGGIGIKDGIVGPTAILGTSIIYVDSADGDLKIVYGDGVVKTIVVDT